MPILGGRGNDRVKAVWYIGTQALESTDGAAASVVVLLIWIYYTAQIVLRPQSGRAGAMARLPEKPHCPCCTVGFVTPASDAAPKASGRGPTQGGPKHGRP